MSNLFIGRMSIRVDLKDDRYKKKYYNAGTKLTDETNNRDWINGLNVDDYVYISINFKEPINKGFKKVDSKICLWKVKKIDEYKTYFEEILDDIGIKLHKLVSLKILKITEVTTNLAIKSSNIHAFWQLELADNTVLDSTLIKKISKHDYYKNESNFRKIILLNTEEEIDKESQDIQMYYEQNIIKLYPAPFIKQSIFDKFNDQTHYLENDRITRKKKKDNFLKKIRLGEIDLTIPQLYDAMFTSYSNEENKKKIKPKPTEKEASVDKEKRINTPLNQILYGPPGTGKTYNNINKALEIIFNLSEEYKIKSDREKENELVEKAVTYLGDKVKDENEKREVLKDCFDSLQKNGQIEFITFHQSYGYEEFVEGIKPCNLNDCNNEHSDIKYAIHSGVFKSISNKAIFEAKINKVKKSLLPLELETKTKKLFKIVSIANSIQGNFKVKTEKGKDQDIRIVDLEKIFFNNSEDVHNNSYTMPFAKYLQELELKAEDFDETHKYILIIDEINRGNISKIFGELITLIEESKRLGNDEALEITLPYSGEKFGVPKNLCIIGTMNTADRSIAPIDTALRRRFEFIEMPPKPEKLSNNVDGIKLQKLLTAMNARIEYIYDRDHTIGHTYLLDVKSLDELKQAFKNKILPLLSEYFYEDWKNIKIVLNEEEIDGFIQSKDNNQYLPKNRNGKVLYKFKDIDDLTENDFKRIYHE